jgi:pimeloyl-ACP methyl ester carboxylesterase
MEPRPFTVHVADDILADLRGRLARVRWPDEIPGARWRYGTDLAYLRGLVGYWRDRYDWRAHEARLNEFRQFTVPLAGIELHFIHQPGVGPNPLPLLLSHGWPGSVWEFHELIPLLTDPARFGADPADAFTVVAPSLPGYGFSFRPDQPRFGVVEIADAFAELMTDILGYDRFVAQGGDWGSFVTARLAFAHADHLPGIHLNMLPLRRDVGRPTDATGEEAKYYEELQQWLREETGYQWIQGTKPQTLAYGLTDSPVGLAAWIVEKFRTWGDCGGDVERCFTKDELLTNITIYWATGAINSSFWPYYARFHDGWPIPDGARIDVPTAYAAFPREIVRPPRSLAEQVFNIRRWTTMPAGGHFAALEQPIALAEDLRAFFRQFRT